ncbi:uncharacterized protein MCYG_04970 [Microsporum canis CBS 113480]|uniref:Uncharacterized protein n=1 Tax=Arthroderma otae (strain ATCC MYA-4605 / CBS 113480) TaxID=554155 RepID=C5FQJ8_ARTOC|nr:uncharacterized protein MCYG_04970 [Microsporum canis CBS 113480]EEQ32151.1 predicted protein [Microsporum canis CBS 113480]
MVEAGLLYPIPGVSKLHSRRGLDIKIQKKTRSSGWTVLALVSTVNGICNSLIPPTWLVVYPVLLLAARLAPRNMTISSGKVATSKKRDCGTLAGHFCTMQAIIMALQQRVWEYFFWTVDIWVP